MADELHLGVQSALSNVNLAQLRLRMGAPTEATEPLTRGLCAARDLGAANVLLFGVLVYADLLAEFGELDRAAQLLGVLRSHSSRDTVGDELERVSRRLSDHGVEVAVGADDDSDAGLLTLEQVVGEFVSASAPSESHPIGRDGGASQPEREPPPIMGA
jgi:hypothetical protein